jgi:hypothetical protein
MVTAMLPGIGFYAAVCGCLAAIFTARQRQAGGSRP